MRSRCQNRECDRLVYKQQGMGLCHRCYEITGIIRHLLGMGVLQVGDPEKARASGLVLPKGVKA